MRKQADCFLRNCFFNASS